MMMQVSQSEYVGVFLFELNSCGACKYMQLDFVSDLKH